MASASATRSRYASISLPQISAGMPNGSECPRTTLRATRTKSFCRAKDVLTARWPLPSVTGMAEIVVGIASSHTPQLSSGVDMWPDHADRDRRVGEQARLLGKDGEYHSYDEILTSVGPGVAEQLTDETWQGKYRRAQDAIATLALRLSKAQPDIAVVIGDDQRELFLDDGIPALACYAGDELVDFPPDEDARARQPKGIRAASWAVHADHPERHPVDGALSRHIAEQLSLADYDITLLTQQPAGRSLGHAFTFPRYRLGLRAATPIVPIFVNTYYQPNVPSAARCFDLGLA